jgi:hypothetical protein
VLSATGAGAVSVAADSDTVAGEASGFQSVLDMADHH